MSEDRVRLLIDNHVAHVELSRPEKRNGLDLAMFEAIAATGAQIAAMPAIREWC